MPTDLLEQLADLPVPPAPPPQTFDRAVHSRINSRLIVAQTSDFLLQGFGFAAAHFAKALLGLLRLTLTGKMEGPKNARDDSSR
jgi:hypothetical protein